MHGSPLNKTFPATCKKVQIVSQRLLLPATEQMLMDTHKDRRKDKQTDIGAFASKTVLPINIYPLLQAFHSKGFILISTAPLIYLIHQPIGLSMTANTQY